MVTIVTNWGEIVTGKITMRCQNDRAFFVERKDGGFFIAYDSQISSLNVTL